MNFRCFFNTRTAARISNLRARVSPSLSTGSPTAGNSNPHSFRAYYRALPFFETPKTPDQNHFGKFIHTSQQVNSDDSPSDLESESENDAATTEFLSRFVWVMRKKLIEAYPGCDKETVDGMLLIIVEEVVSEMEKGGIERMTGAGMTMPSQDFSEDLWRTVWEVSNVVLQDMEKEKKKEKMKGFLQSEEVKEMYRFAGEIGIRGDMLRELRFKWAREKMEESEFYQSLEKLRVEASMTEMEKLKKESVGDEEGRGEKKVVSLPKRHGKIKYKIYGLDLSDSKWAKVADKIHESGEIMWPQEAKPMSGKCKLVTDKILALQEGDDPAQLLSEWISLLQPTRIDWIAFLDRLKDQNYNLYFKIAELALSEESFQANIRDYSKLIDALAKQNRLEDAERILKNMNENGILPDVIASTVALHMYCKSGNIDRAKESFDALRDHGYQPDLNIYNSMIMAHVNAGKPKDAESLLRQMETRDIKPTKEIFTAMIRSFAQIGDVKGADRIFTCLKFAGYEPSLESCTLMIEACGKAGEPEHARYNFDQMMKLGNKPDDRCIASMLSAYERRNLLDKALDFLLELEKKGFEPGVRTYTVLVDWLCKLKLFEEAEQILGKISELGEAPPFKIHISLCDMYLKSGSEKKALQALGVLESKIEVLEAEDFTRIINSLMEAGFEQDAERLHGMMKPRGFESSEQLKMNMLTSRFLGKSSERKKYPLDR